LGGGFGCRNAPQIDLYWHWSTG